MTSMAHSVVMRTSVGDMGGRGLSHTPKPNFTNVPYRYQGSNLRLYIKFPTYSPFSYLISPF